MVLQMAYREERRLGVTSIGDRGVTVRENVTLHARNSRL